MHAVAAPAAPDLVADPHRRWKGLGVLTVAAVLLHLAALGGVEWGWPQHDAALPPATAMQVRVVEGEPPAAPPVMATAAAPVVAAAAPQVKVAVTRARASTTAPAAAAPAAPVLAPVALRETEPLLLALNTDSAQPHPASAATAEPSAGDEALPHYRTRMPPATTLRYELQRGVLRGTGELAWKPQGDHYELRLEGKVGALPVLTQTSTGVFDDAGIAPERFTDQRVRRATVAANFQRAPGKSGVGKITFSGPSTELALRAGAQDRLSWMVQLAAIVAAEPSLRIAGAKVAMVVVGAHGEAGVWLFRCVGPDAVETGAGTVNAIKFMREPREAYDTTVQVWLDPLRHDLPVRATQQSGPSDEPFELRLQAVVGAS